MRVFDQVCVFSVLTDVLPDLQDGEENKAVSRLKRYIALCGARPNYKKLLEDCRSVKAKVTVLKKQLEELGVEGRCTLACFSLLMCVCDEYV